MKTYSIVLVLALVAAASVEAATCPCALNGVCYYGSISEPRHKTEENVLTELGKKYIAVQPDQRRVELLAERNCGECEMTVGLLQDALQGDCDYECNSGNEPVCDQCVCNDLEDFCVRTFKYFKMMLQECQNDIHSLTSDEINMLLDPSTTPEELCQYEDQC